MQEVLMKDGNELIDLGGSDSSLVPAMISTHKTHTGMIIAVDQPSPTVTASLTHLLQEKRNREEKHPRVEEQGWAQCPPEADLLGQQYHRQRQEENGQTGEEGQLCPAIAAPSTVYEGEVYVMVFRHHSEEFNHLERVERPPQIPSFLHGMERRHFPKISSFRTPAQMCRINPNEKWLRVNEAETLR
ncbi:hypothetical protein L3Q82_002664 [Scortum barcoo]|uniref:Uncharacterized protein n=1 Tax=Scortum barcoo TaxID=214431 RepID=A0ACB8VUH0_9TELE|nr:hypothetical protein L3Q82_002664 [Scortum barcoo]